MFYFLCYNIQYDLKRIVACYRVFAIILSFQVFAVFLYYAGAGMLISDEAYKGSMRIPFAASNVIASAIIPAVLCIFCTQHKKKIIGVLEILIYMFALVLLKSRGAILIFAILAEIYIILLIFKIKNIMNRWIVGTLFILLNMLGVWIILHSSFFYTYFGGFRGFSSLNDITSRRVEVWQYSLEEFFKKPIFGRGLYYDETNFIGSTGSHNIILETLMNCGIASAILHICIIVKLLWTNVRNIVSRKVSFHRINQARLSIVVVLVTLYANSMIEASYYNYINDVIFWSLAGFLKRDWIESASCEMMVGHKEETMGYLEAKR